MGRGIARKTMLERSMEEEIVLKKSIVKRVVAHPNITDRTLKTCGIGSEEEVVVEESETLWKSIVIVESDK